MAMHRRSTAIYLSLSRFDVLPVAAGDAPVPEPHAIIDFHYDETCLTHSCSQSGRLNLKNTTRLPAIASTYSAPFVDLMLSNRISRVRLLPQGFSEVYDSIESLIAGSVRMAAEEAFFAGVDVIGVAAKATVVTDWFEPAEFCSACLMDVGPKDFNAIRMGCGHSYHEECMPHSGEEGRRCSCPECFSGDTEPLIKMKPLDLVKIKLAGDLFDIEEDLWS